MRRIAVISDIHGNTPALSAVLSDIQSRDIQTIICLGDLAGKGPHSAEAVDIIRENCETVVEGNWDYFISNNKPAKKDDLFKWHRDALGEERLEYLRHLPVYHDIRLSGKLVRLCHASPHDIFHRTFIHTDREERMRLFAPVDGKGEPADVIGYGDIHGAHVDHFGGKTIFNTGSVGNPLDITQASYAILEGDYGSKEPAPFLLSIVRIPYDINLAVKHAEESSMPGKKEYIQELLTGVYRNKK